MDDVGTQNTTHMSPFADGWEQPISQDRQAKLQALINSSTVHSEDRPNNTGPFSGVRLTGAEVFWLATQVRETHPPYGISRLHLEGANLSLAHLEGADLSHVHLEQADLFQAYLHHANLRAAHIEHARLSEARLEDAYLENAHLEGADLSGAHLEGAHLSDANLQDAYLYDAYLKGTQLTASHLEGANLSRSHLEGAVLNGAYFSDSTNLEDAILGDSEHGYVSVGDVRWNALNLAVVSLPERLGGLYNLLGDERAALKQHDRNGRPKNRATRLKDFKEAVRAYRQLAVALQNQGMSEAAAQYAYRAQLLQQQVLWRQRKWGAYLFSRFLDGLAGYGYKPGRSLVAYILLVLGFAAAYYGLGQAFGPSLPPHEALVVSLTAFHGRGFFSQQFSPGDPQSMLAAAEAVVGLLIEISFIATFTQRFFSAK